MKLKIIVSKIQRANYSPFILFTALFVVVGTGLLIVTRAATNTASFEVENATLSGGASLGTDTGASGGSFISFGASSNGIFSVTGLSSGQQVSGSINVEAVPLNASNVTKVEFRIDNNLVQTENGAPYCLGGNTSGQPCNSYSISSLSNGNHTLKATMYYGSSQISEISIGFNVGTGTTPCSGGGSGGAGSVGSKLSINCDKFLLAGQAFPMWGVRTASATYTQAQTDHLIAQLNDYKSHGVNTVTVFFMGSRGANYDPFSGDGTQIDSGHLARMEQIIQAADARGMVVVVGIFYQHAPFGLDNATAVRTAVQTVTNKLSKYANIMINIANEQNSSGWSDMDEIYDFRVPQNIIDLCKLVHQTQPGRLCGGGGYSRANNKIIGVSSDIDALLFDTGGSDHDSAALYDEYLAAGVTNKPMANVETFGGWTNNYPRGIFDSSVKQAYYNQVDAGINKSGLSIFFHNSPWMQSTSESMRYDLAGYGTSSDPGIRWYFEYIKSKRGV